MNTHMNIIRKIGIHALFLAFFITVFAVPALTAQGVSQNLILAAGRDVGGSSGNNIGGSSGRNVGGGGGSNCDLQHFCNPIAANDLSGLLSSLLQVVTAIGAVVVVFFIILAGFNYVTARGDEKKIQSATKTFTWTAVGAAVILGAQVIADALKGTVDQLGVGK